MKATTAYKNIPPKTQKIITDFLSAFYARHPKDNIKLEGLLIAGSFLDKKKVSQNSDLDLFIVIKSNGKRYRGMSVSNGIYVDYFINPIKQYRQNLLQIKDSSGNTLANALAYGHIITDKSHQLANLQNAAKKIITNTLSQSLPPFRVSLAKYFIEDYLRDIQDNYQDKNDFAWQYNTALLKNYLIEIFCRVKRIALIKPKYQQTAISKKSPQFVRLYDQILTATNRQQEMRHLEKLANYVLDQLGVSSRTNGKSNPLLIRRVQILLVQIIVQKIKRAPHPTHDGGALFDLAVYRKSHTA
ncbi:MAG: hypothetical protein WC400_02745 [Patescibacteria group bacterium]